MSYNFLIEAASLNNTYLALIGVAISAGLGAIGSSLGVGICARSATGLLSKEPEKFGTALALSALASTQSLYGLLFGFIVLIQTGMLSGAPKALTGAQAVAFILAGLPVGIACLISGIEQGKTAGSGMKILAESPESASQGIVLAALIETFAIFGLVISLLIVIVGLAKIG